MNTISDSKLFGKFSVPILSNNNLSASYSTGVPEAIEQMGVRMYWSIPNEIETIELGSNTLTNENPEEQKLFQLNVSFSSTILVS